MDLRSSIRVPSWFAFLADSRSTLYRTLERMIAVERGINDQTMVYCGLACCVVYFVATEVHGWIPIHGQASFVDRKGTLTRSPRFALTAPTKDAIADSTNRTAVKIDGLFPEEHASLQDPEIELLSIDLPALEMNGEAKIEEPGDREAIVRSIKEYQSSVSQEEPHFPIGTIIQRFLDTIEDIFLHLRRLPYDYGWVLEKTPEDLPTIVVLGSGWAAHALLKVADTYKLRVIVVSPSNHFVFTPMLASASVGTVEYRSMTEAVRSANPMIENYIEGKAMDVDINKQTIKIKLNSLLDGLREGEPPEIELKYDKLIVSVGCKVADSLVPGAFANSLRLKTCDDARRLRNAVGECLEYASRPDVQDDDKLPSIERERRQTERTRRVTFAIVGGGPTGVELAGELSDFIKDITRPRVGAYPQLRNVVRIVLIHGGSELVPQFDEGLRKHAYSSLTHSGIEVRLSTVVNEVGDGFVKLSSKGENSVEETVLSGLNVWAAGTEPVPFIKVLLDKLPPNAKGPQGKIVVDEWLRCSLPDSAQFGSIMVMGDAAAFADGRNSWLPQTAQVAGQQGAYAARMLDRDYDLSVTPPKLRTKSEMMNLWLTTRGLENAKGCKYRQGSCWSSSYLIRA